MMQIQSYFNNLTTQNKVIFSLLHFSNYKEKMEIKNRLSFKKFILMLTDYTYLEVNFGTKTIVNFLEKLLKITKIVNIF